MNTLCKPVTIRTFYLVTWQRDRTVRFYNGSRL